MVKAKIVHTELKGKVSTRFEIIKSILGIQNDAEVIRFLIQQYFRDYLESSEVSAQKELEKDRVIVKEFMQKYGDEWHKLGEE
jgi:CHAD domain-containing protein